MVISNRSAAPTQYATLTDLLSHRATHQPQQTAFIFLADGETESEVWSYAQLHDRAKAIAQSLMQSTQPGDRVLLIYPSSLDFVAAFFGCLYAGVIAVPVYPPRPNRSMERLRTILKDAGAKVALTTSSILELVERRLSEEPDLGRVDWLASDRCLTQPISSTWHPRDCERDTLAFLQYTSGSTGQPKGVMVSHGNLLHNLAYAQQGYGLSDQDISVTWLPNFHDLGLIDGILQPLFSGIVGVVMPPTAFVQKPIRWLQAISRYGGTHSGGPNFAYDLCTRKITQEQLRSLDLSTWVSAYNGAEPIRRETLERFAEYFHSCGYRSHFHYPHYGMAEATLVITGSQATAEPIFYTVDGDALAHNQVLSTSASSRNRRTLVGCGHTWADTEVAIVNPDTKTRCAPDQVGEIWTAGGSVAQGYWQRPQETAETFQAYLADTGEGPFLRTGDLGFLRIQTNEREQAGELFVTGRLKDVVIIRGENHYPQDIERTVEQSHPYLRPACSAAFAIEVQHEEKLVVVAEVERRYSHRSHPSPTNDQASSLRQVVDWEPVFTDIRRAVALEHELEIYAIVLLRTSHILKTSSGKIQRRACRQAFWDQTLEQVAAFYLDADFRQSLPRSQPLSITTTQSAATPIPQFAAKPTPQSAAKVDSLVHWLREYARDRINSLTIDERRTIPPYIVLDFGNQGLLGLQVPPSHGGIGLSHRSTLQIFEQLAAIDLTLALFTVVHNILGVRPILNYGQPQLREEWLPRLATGRELGAFALTEPGAGSNPQNITSRAVPIAGGGWALYGEKIWSGSAAWAGIINVFTQQVDEQGTPKGMTGFAVCQGSPGLRLGPEALTMGLRGMIQNSVYLEGVTVSAEQVLAQPGLGMSVAQDAMMYGRLSIATLCVGGMKRCAQLMASYADRRQISTGRLLENPITLLNLADLTAAITAIECLVRGIADCLDLQQTVPIEAYTICKIIAPDLFWQAADTLIQTLGGRGYIETNVAPQLMRDARILRIFEGPTETLKMFLGSRLVHQPEEFCQFLQQLGATVVADQLLQAVAQVQQYQSTTALFSDPITCDRWTQTLIGELAAWSLLQAMLQQAESQAQTLSVRDAQPTAIAAHRSLTWVKQHWQRILMRATSLSPSEQVVLASATLTELIDRYQQDIGWIAPSPAGEDRQRDENLSAPYASSQADLNPQIPTAATPTATPTVTPIPATDDPAVQTWIIQWLAKTFRFAHQEIKSHHTFAEYGIDSVTAVEFVYDLQHWLTQQPFLPLPTAPQSQKQPDIEVGWLWQFPTIADFAQQITHLYHPDRHDAAATPHLEPVLDLEAEAQLDESIRPNATSEIATTPAQRIFLTGATGFLGAFLLHELLQQTDATIYCLVRATDAIAGFNRIRQTLEHYQKWSSQPFNQSFDQLLSDRRIIAVPGDLTQPWFGWEESQFHHLASQIDAIYHSAATVNWVYSYSDLKPSNVFGTETVLRFATQGKLKPVHYMSTIAVFESPVYADRSISETNPIDHGQGLYLGYSQSKWVAEKLMQQAHDRGIPITIYRPPMISGDSQTGAWFTGDFSCRLIKGCIQMGMAPQLDYWFDLSPVDFVSRAIVHLAQQPQTAGQTFHLMNPQGLHWNALFDQIRQWGYPLRSVSYQTWQHHLQTALPKDNALYPLLPFLLKHPTDQPLTTLELYQRSHTCRFSSEHTAQILAAAHLSCPPLNQDLLATYFSYFTRSQFLPPPMFQPMESVPVPRKSAKILAPDIE